MDKQKALDRIEVIKAELKELELVLKTEELLTPIFSDEIGKNAYILKYENSVFYSVPIITININTPVFRDKETATNWGYLFDVLLELRGCKGNVPVIQGKPAWTVITNYYQDETITCEIGCSSYCITWGAFDSRETATAAMNKVGKERIIRAFRTLGHIKRI